MKTKGKIIFYEEFDYYIEPYVRALKHAGFEVEIFFSAEVLLDSLRKETHDVVLIVSGLVVRGHGNNFGGKRKENFMDCASLLADELDKIPEASKIKKIIFTNWGHIHRGEYFEILQKDKRFSRVLKKIDYVPRAFLKEITKLLTE